MCEYLQEYEDLEEEYHYYSEEELENKYLVSNNNYELLNRYPEYHIWLKSLFEIEKYSDKYLISYQEENITQCEITILSQGEVIGNLTLQIKHPERDNDLFYPNVPPVIIWNTPELILLEYLDICYMKCIRKQHWNMCYSLLDILDKIYDYLLPLKLQKRNIIQNKDIFNYLVTISNMINDYPSNIDTKLPELGVINTIINQQQHKKGTGYSQGNIESWDINKWDNKQDDIFKQLDNIYQLYLITNKLTKLDLENIQHSSLKKFMISIILNASIQDFDKYTQRYLVIFRVSNWWYLTYGLDNHLHSLIVKFYQELIEIFIISNDTYPELKELEILLKPFQQEMITQLENKQIKKIKQQNQITNSIKTEENIYIDTLKQYQLTTVEEFKQHSYLNEINQKPVNGWLKRLMIEWKDLGKSLPLHPDGSIFLSWGCEGTKTQYFKVLIMPSLTTPYGGGCYLFDMFIPIDYPNTPPKMNFITTGGGSVRFNPNLYNCGKVCLSLLGTWSGEKWNPDISNLYQLLVSILGLIFVEEPYFNEPGYQRLQGTDQGDKNSFEYNTTIRIANIKYGILDMIKNPPEEFKEVITLHYGLNKSKIIDNINQWITEYETLPNIQQTLTNLLIELKKLI